MEYKQKLKAKHDQITDLTKSSFSRGVKSAVSQLVESLMRGGRGHFVNLSGGGGVSAFCRPMGPFLSWEKGFAFCQPMGLYRVEGVLLFANQ